MLPFLPGDLMLDICDVIIRQIEEHFRLVKDHNERDVLQRLYDLSQYVRRTWCLNSVWDVDSVSCYMRHLRTNNDVEGFYPFLFPFIHHRYYTLLQFRFTSLQKMEPGCLSH